MSENISKLFTTQFATNLELKLQQMGSKLRGRVSEGAYVGKQASPVNQIGAIQLKAPAGRFAPKNRTDADFTRRWVFPQDGEIDQLIDGFDLLRTIVDPKSQYVQNAAMAVGRGWDDAIIAAFFATSYTGQDAAALTAETFDTGSFQIASTFGAGSAVGLTVDKMIEIKRLFRHYHVDLESEEATIIIGSTQEADLFKQTQVTNLDYTDRPVLVDGKVTRFMGLNIVVSERLSVVSNVRNCIAFVKSGMHLGVWKDMVNRVSIRNELSSEPYDLYTAVSFGATRTQPGKVLSVLCSDSVGADITP